MCSVRMMTAATVGGALTFGMALALLGRLQLTVARRASAQDSALRHGLLALNIALVPLMLLSGVLLDIYGTRALLVAGSVMLAVALVGLSLQLPSASVSSPRTGEIGRAAAAIMFLAGFGASALGTASIVLMPRALLVWGETAAALNLGFVFLALGALLTHTLADILLEKIQLRRSLAVFALLGLAPAFLGVLPDDLLAAGSQVEGGWGGDGQPAALFAGPACWLAALVLFFYVPLEASISLWTFALLRERGKEEHAATSVLSGFWTAFVVSRLVAALLPQNFSFSRWAGERTAIVVLPILAAVLLGNLAGAGSRGRLRGGLVLLGLLLGPVLPTLLSVVFGTTPDAKGTAFGLLFAAGSLGSMILAPFLSLRLPIFLALLVAAAALVLGLMTP